MPSLPGIACTMELTASGLPRKAMRAASSSARHRLWTSSLALLLDSRSVDRISFAGYARKAAHDAAFTFSFVLSGDFPSIILYREGSGMFGFIPSYARILQGTAWGETGPKT